MKKNYTLCLLLALLIIDSSFSQNGCGNGRYQSKIFSNFTLASNITYGQNIKLGGTSQTLLLDVYQPLNDDSTILRPLIIWVHGGTFVGGSKTGTDVKPLSEDFAKMGFVTASIEYRLGMQDYPFPGPDSIDAIESVFRAVHDARAAVRFFKKNFSENGNTYKIDTNLIFLAGVSAGAITTVQLAYLDEESEIPSYVDTSKVGLGGGIEGNSGNPGYSSKVRAILNSAGAIRDTSWIKTNDTPIISFHGTADGTVPYGTEMIYVGGFYPIMFVSGSGTIHTRTDNLGISNCLVPFIGADHTPHDGNAIYTDTLEKFTSNFFMQFICNSAPLCSYQIQVGAKEENPREENNVIIYPNPSSGKFFFSLDNDRNYGQTIRFSLYDVFGREVFSENSKNKVAEINAGNVPRGIYFYKVSDENGEMGKGSMIIE